MVGTKLSGGVKNSIGNGEAKELTCMSHGHELRLEVGGIAGGKGILVRGGQKRKNWDNYNSINNKIYLKKKKLALVHY